MSNVVVLNIWRFIFLLLLQVLVLKQIEFEEGVFFYVNVLIYPIFILLLPIRIPHPLLILLGFLMGIILDFFYDSPGVHASATVFTAFIRPYILGILEPRGGYKVNQSPTKKNLGFNWFLIYAAIMLFAHLFFYFSVEAFTFVYFKDIFLRTVFSFLASIFFLLAYQFILNPKQ